MDPMTGQSYSEDEIAELPQEIKDRLVFGTAAEIGDLHNKWVQEQSDELEDILTDMEKLKVISLDDPPRPKEQFYSVNRAARRAAEKRDRKARRPSG